MSVVLDAGALVAIERGDRRMVAVMKEERDAGRTPRTHGGVIGQVWRGGRGRQARLSRAMQAVAVWPIDDDLGRRSGVLLGRSGLSDVIDAAVVLIATDGDEIYTADPADLSDLARAAGKIVELVQV